MIRLGLVVLLFATAREMSSALSEEESSGRVLSLVCLSLFLYQFIKWYRSAIKPPECARHNTCEKS